MTNRSSRFSCAESCAELWQRMLRIVLLQAVCIAGVNISAHAATDVAIPVAPRPDVRVLIDISGSMKQNDPNNLRRPALAMLVELYPKNARGGIWSFAQSADVLVPLQSVSDGWREAGRRKAAQIGSTGLFTNIPMALERATADLTKADPAYHTSVILMTDGMVDISKVPAENAAATERLFKEIVPKLRARGITVHTVALSKSADREMMQRLAVDTGGFFAVAETPEKLNKAFLQAFDAAAPAEQIPLKDDGFTVDSAIEELTALVFHKPGKPVVLKGPDGHEVSAAGHAENVSWFQGPDFDLVTIKKPAVGQWKLGSTPEPGTRVTIVSNLSLASTRLPESLFINNTASITAALKEQDAVLVRPELLGLATFKAKVQRRGDGKEWGLDLVGNAAAAGKPPVDGYYRAALPMLTEVGIYDIAIDVDGKTFQRSQRQTVAVRENFTVKVESTQTLPPAHSVVLFAQNPEINILATKVTAHIKSGDKNTEQVVAASAERQWVLPIPPSENNARLEVSFEVSGQYLNGDEFTATTQVVAVDDTGGQVVAAEKAAVHDSAAAKPEEHAKPAEHKEEHAKEGHEKAEAPAAEEAKPEEPAADAEPGWKKWALYAGLALGNILVVGLGYLAYRMVMGGSKSKVLTDDEDDDAEVLSADKKSDGKAKAEDKKAPAKAKKSLDDLDLPDDAIDIDPGAGKKK